MTLTIEDAEIDRVLRELTALTGESPADALRKAARERLVREQAKHGEREALVADLHAIAARCASLPVLDDRSPDEILGYDENGLPT